MANPSELERNEIDTWELSPEGVAWNIVESYRRGAKAMREKAAKEAESVCDVYGLGNSIGAAIRSLEV